jgi:FixJ family two-component response regulator
MATTRQIKFLIKRFKNTETILSYLNDLLSDMTNRQIAEKYHINSTQVQRDRNNFTKRIIERKVLNFLKENS